jgi:hypothetical protein
VPGAVKVRLVPCPVPRTPLSAPSAQSTECGSAPEFVKSIVPPTPIVSAAGSKA